MKTELFDEKIGKRLPKLLSEILLIRMIIYLKQFLTAAFWGGTFIAGRIVAKGIDPYSAAFLRFTIAGIFLLTAIWIKEGKLPSLSKRQLLSVVCLGMTGIFAYNPGSGNLKE